MLKQTNFKELQKQRNEAIYDFTNEGSSDNVDYLGSLYRNNGYFGSLLIADKIKQSLPAIIASYDQYLQDQEIKLDPSQEQDALEFRAQELLKQYGIDEMSPAGILIQKAFSEEGAKRQQLATNGETYLIYEENLREDKELHRIENTQDSWDQMIATVMNGWSKDSFGRITHNRGVIGPKEAAMSIWEEALRDPKYGGAGGWQRFVDDWGKWETPISPGNTKRMQWVLKNPKIFEVNGELHKKWRSHHDAVLEENKKTLKDDDNSRLNNAITAYANGDYEGPNKYQLLAAEHQRNEGNPETQKFYAEKMLITQTDNNTAMVDHLMKVISQGDTQEFYALLSKYPDEIKNIAAAKPFAESVEALINVHGADFDNVIDVFAKDIVKGIDATAFVQPGATESLQSREVKNATKALYYNLFNNTYAHIKDPFERARLAKRDIENLAATADTPNNDGSQTKGKGIFRHLDGTARPGGITFTAFYDGTLPGDHIISFDELQKEVETTESGLNLNQMISDNKINGKVIVSETELSKIAVQLRSGNDVIRLPENVRLLEQFYPNFNARQFINKLFSQNEKYKKEEMYIPPDAYEAFRERGDVNLRQEQRLPYLMSLYGPWSNEVGKHSTMSNFARTYSDGFTETLQIGAKILEMPQLETEGFFPRGEDAKKLIQFGSEYNIHYLPNGTGGWFEP